jgi:hemerythrin superfamily protein
MRTTTGRKTGPIEMLKADHDHVKELFREFSELGDRAHKSKQRLAEQIFQELEVHSRLEEEIFYPAVREAAEEETREVVAEGIEEHHVVDVLIEEIRGLSPEDEAFDAKMKVLSENVEHHIEEEEGEMFPGARKNLGGDELETLGRQMLELRERISA